MQESRSVAVLINQMSVGEEGSWGVGVGKETHPLPFTERNTEREGGGRGEWTNRQADRTDSYQGLREDYLSLSRESFLKDEFVLENLAVHLSIRGTCLALFLLYIIERFSGLLCFNPRVVKRLDHPSPTQPSIQLFFFSIFFFHEAPLTFIPTIEAFSPLSSKFGDIVRSVKTAFLVLPPLDIFVFYSRLLS